MARKPVILRLALATLVLMPAVALIIDYFFETVDLRTLVWGKVDFTTQILIGLGVGLVSAFAARFMVSLPMMQKVKSSYVQILGNFDLNWSEILFISMCAGVGEEFLFRGALQPFMGIYITSVLFVFIHGYLNPRDWRLSIYGLFMTIVIVVLGTLAEKYGLLVAIIAHTIIDVVLLHQLQQAAALEPTETDTDSDGQTEMD
jgi:membrane protease YdiL (CAAX protease family)